MIIRVKLLIRWLIALAVGVSVLLAIFFFIKFFTVKPPSMEMETARKALSKARGVHADVYAPELYNKAKQTLDQAMLEWRRQNQLYFFKRDYAKCKELALKATIKSEESFSKSGVNKNNLRDNYLANVKELNAKLDLYHKTFIKLPLSSRIRKDYEFGKLSLAESLSAFEKNDFKTATAKLAKGKSRIAQSDLFANAFLKEFFADYNKWHVWYKEAIEQSKKDGINVIIVNKLERKLYVYSNGEKKAEFDVEFGKNWLGPKKVKGDFATPEGQYRITKKKEGSETKYHKALLINYPNEHDSVRFNELKRKGVIAKKSDIGGLIEIHGDGGKGVDWTEGCIALSNSDVNKLYGMISSGTPVTIIGSLKPLNELLN